MTDDGNRADDFRRSCPPVSLPHSFPGCEVVLFLLNCAPITQMTLDKEQSKRNGESSRSRNKNEEEDGR